ncbi:MAG: hypothetical protein LBF72_03675 [Holosporales bacterium]|nr:hypothetical protein [Holosporales bacterium]
MKRANRMIFMSFSYFFNFSFAAGSTSPFPPDASLSTSFFQLPKQHIEECKYVGEEVINSARWYAMGTVDGPPGDFRTIAKLLNVAYSKGRYPYEFIDIIPLYIASVVFAAQTDPVAFIEMVRLAGEDMMASPVLTERCNRFLLFCKENGWYNSSSDGYKLLIWEAATTTHELTVSDSQLLKQKATELFSDLLLEPVEPSADFPRSGSFPFGKQQSATGPNGKPSMLKVFYENMDAFVKYAYSGYEVLLFLAIKLSATNSKPSYEAIGILLAAREKQRRSLWKQSAA